MRYKNIYLAALAVAATMFGTSSAFAAKAPVGPPFRLADPRNSSTLEDIRLNVTRDFVCVSRENSTICGKEYNNTPRYLTTDGYPKVLQTTDDSICVLDSKSYTCFDQRSSDKHSEPATDALSLSELTCVIKKGEIHCSGNGTWRVDYLGWYIGKPDLKVSEIRGAKRLFALDRYICAETSDDSFCFGGEKENSQSAFRLSRILRLPEPQKEPVTFLEVTINARLELPKPWSEKKAKHLSFSGRFVSGRALKYFSGAAIRSGKLWKRHRLITFAENTVELPSVPMGHIKDSPCYLFDGRIRCLEDLAYSTETNAFVPTDFHQRHQAAIQKIESLEDVTQLIGSRDYFCALTANGLMCYSLFIELHENHYDLPKEVLKAAGVSYGFRLDTLEKSVKRSANVFYVEKAQLLRKQADILADELTNASCNPNLVRLFAALSFRTIIETTHSAIVQQRLLPDFRAQLDTRLKDSGISTLNDFGNPPAITRLALRLLVSDLQVLRQHITEPQVRGRFEGVVTAIGEALAQGRAAQLDLPFLKDALATLSTAPRSQSFALQALGLVEYLEMGGMLR